MKRDPRTDHTGGTQIDLVTYLLLSLWSSEANQHKCVRLWIRDAKKEHGGPPKLKNKSRKQEIHRKMGPEGAPKRPQRDKTS